MGIVNRISYDTFLSSSEPSGGQSLNRCSCDNCSRVPTNAVCDSDSSTWFSPSTSAAEGQDGASAGAAAANTLWKPVCLVARNETKGNVCPTDDDDGKVEEHRRSDSCKTKYMRQEI